MAELYPGAVLRMVLWRTSDAWAGACRLKQAARSLTKDGMRRVVGREPERPMLAPAIASQQERTHVSQTEHQFVEEKPIWPEV